MSSPDLLPMAVAVLIAVPALGSCIGIGLASMKMLEASARQPELMPQLQTKFFLAVGVTDDLVGTRSAVDLVRVAAAALGGQGGGGRPDMAQAGGPDADKAADAIAAVKTALAG